MFQLWVNLPKTHKMDPPRYQSLMAGQMGKVELPDDGGFVRVIAGEYQGVKGPAKTVTPINLFDIHLGAHGSARFSFPEGENTGLVVMDGEVTINKGKTAKALDFILFENAGEEILLEGLNSHLLLLNGEPINEPMVQYGPFVMNTRDEIRQAFADFQSGKFGEFAD